MRGLNLLLRFLIELACLAALAIWGAGSTDSVAANVAIAVVLVVVAATIWGIWAAPRAAHRLAGRGLIALEVALLACSCVLLALAGAPLAAALLALLALTNGALLRRDPEAGDPSAERELDRAAGD